MKECPLCGAAMFPKQTVCPQCAAQEHQRRGPIGWSVLVGGALILAGGLVIAFSAFGMSAVVQVAVGLAMTLYGLRFRQTVWLPGPDGGARKDP